MHQLLKWVTHVVNVTTESALANSQQSLPNHINLSGPASFIVLHSPLPQYFKGKHTQVPSVCLVYRYYSPALCQIVFQTLEVSALRKSLFWFCLNIHSLIRYHPIKGQNKWKFLHAHLSLLFMQETGLFLFKNVLNVSALSYIENILRHSSYLETSFWWIKELNWNCLGWNCSASFLR